MAFILPSLIMTLLSLPIYFFLSTNIAEWFVWTLYALISVFIFVKSFIEYGSLLKGEPKTVGEVVGIAAFPFVSIVMGVLLITFLFVDANKLHLLWIYPIVSFSFEMTVGKRAANRILTDSLEEILIKR